MANKFDANVYNRQFSKDNYKHYHLKVNIKETDVIEQLNKHTNKNRYIINLIKHDIGGNNMKEVKEQALNELKDKLFNSDIEGWREEDTDTMYRWYQGNEQSSSIGKYVSLVSFDEFKYQVEEVIKELKEEMQG